MKNKLFTLAFLLISFNVFSQGDQDVPTRDQVITDDLIVTFSLAVGNDAVDGENFGFDTFRLKENNLRIHFDDTSASASFPSNDWRIVINDTGNGGANYFGIEDATAGRMPFRVEAGAPVNTLYVEADGDVGIKTADPVVDLHIVEGNSPTVRLEQDGSDGFTSQSWDLAGNETNFFIRDVTNGSALPFKIFPGAATNTLTLSAADNVGVGVQTASEKLDVVGNIRSRDIIYADDQMAVGIATPSANASLQLAAVDKGLLLNKLTSLEQITLTGNLTTGDSGLVIYNTTIGGTLVWDGTAWVNITEDDQAVDLLNLNGSNLEISLDDNATTATLDMSPLLASLESRVTALEDAQANGSGQVPELLNYQTVVRNASGDVLANQNVSFRISVLDNTTTAIYTETHSALTTSAYGLVSFNVGSGTIVSGVFSSIDWGAGATYLQVELDINGGTAYQLMGTSQFVSVPYALRAKSADTVNSLVRSQLDENERELEALKNENKEMKKMLQDLLERVGKE